VDKIINSYNQKGQNIMYNKYGKYQTSGRYTSNGFIPAKQTKVRVSFLQKVVNFLVSVWNS
jgi:hypothetical protein